MPETIVDAGEILAYFKHLKRQWGAPRVLKYAVVAAGQGIVFTHYDRQKAEIEYGKAILASQQEGVGRPVVLVNSDNDTVLKLYEFDQPFKQNINNTADMHGLRFKGVAKL